jgi:endoglycosylceramidase
MWPGVEPKARGEYDQNYLNQIETIVSNLSKQGIYVILDFHQDLWHRKFCGEGVPDYVFNICKANEPAETKPFPLPAVNETYPVDAEGNPDLDSCLSRMFATYYLSAEVGAGFQCLYDNVDNLWEAFAGYWKTIAARFQSFENVLGYELINEPWAGDVYKHPQSLLPQYAEKNYLQPLYQYLHNAIRTVDDKKIIFFEGLTIDYWPNGFSAGPGPSEYNDRQALAYHIYCPVDNGNPSIILACDAIDDLFFEIRSRDAKRLGVGQIMTEFGAAEDVKSDLTKMASLADLADRHQQSWMYWQFKYYQDITTCTPQGESLYNEDGTPCENKLKVLSRSYPQATAGHLVQYRYNIETQQFHMQYEPYSNASVFNEIGSTGRTTQIYLVRGTVSTLTGIKVTVSSSVENSSNLQNLNIVCPTVADHNHLQIAQTQAFSDVETISIDVTACLIGDCTCK